MNDNAGPLHLRREVYLIIMYMKSFFQCSQLKYEHKNVLKCSENPDIYVHGLDSGRYQQKSDPKVMQIVIYVRKSIRSQIVVMAK